MVLSAKDIADLEPIFTKAIKDGSLSLGAMLGADIVAGNAMVKEVAFEDIPYIFGGSQKIISGIYMQYNTGVSIPNTDIVFGGHLLLTFKIESAFEIASILTQDLDVPLDKIGVMADSIFGEIGNVFGTSFLSTLANMAGCKLLPSIPTVINYKASSILEYVHNKMDFKNSPILLIQTNLHNDKHMIEGKFFLIPENYKSILYLFKKQN